MSADMLVKRCSVKSVRVVEHAGQKKQMLTGENIGMVKTRSRFLPIIRKKTNTVGPQADLTLAGTVSVWIGTY